MRFRRRSHRLGSGKRRKLEWQNAVVGGTIAGDVTPGTTLPASIWIKVPSGTLNTQVPPDGALEAEDLTLVRLLVSIEMSYHAASVGSQNATMGAGIIVWTGTSDTAPLPTTIPLPVSNGDADWVWWWSTQSSVAAQQAGQSFFGENGDNELFVQSRAMRKLSANQGLLFVVEWFNGLGTSTINNANFEAQIRGLFKLP